MTIGEKIKEQRKLKGYTQEDLAKKIGASRQNIAQWETGNRKPKRESIQKIAAALEVPETVFYFLQNNIKVIEGSTRRITIPPNATEEQAYSLLLKDLELEISQKKVLKLMEKLNPAGQEKVIEYAEDLSKIPEYQKTENE